MRKIKRIVILSFLCIFIVGCSNPDVSYTQPEYARAILEVDGYNDIVITGYNLDACGIEFFFHTGFTATKNNYRIDGVVCSDYVQASSIRFIRATQN